MAMNWCVRFTVCYIAVSTASAALYSNLWAVHVKGGERVARSVADATGFTYINKVGGVSL